MQPVPMTYWCQILDGDAARLKIVWEGGEFSHTFAPAEWVRLCRHVVARQACPLGSTAHLWPSDSGGWWLQTREGALVVMPDIGAELVEMEPRDLTSAGDAAMATLTALARGGASPESLAQVAGVGLLDVYAHLMGQAHLPGIQRAITGALAGGTVDLSLPVGRPRRHLPLEELRALWLDGAGVNSIARTTGEPRTTIRRRLTQMGLLKGEV